MPEFVMPIGAKRDEYADLDPFTRGYIEAMFFTDASCADDGDLEDATFSDLAPSTLETIKRDCAEFQAQHAAAIEAAVSGSDTRGETEAGHDFWYTRNGHGVGFWERGRWPDGPGEPLSRAAKAFGEYSIYRGDDGLIYGSY